MEWSDGVEGAARVVTGVQTVYLDAVSAEAARPLRLASVPFPALL